MTFVDNNMQNAAAMPPPPGALDPDNDHPDFTDRVNTTSRWFTIDDDTFYCARAVPAAVGRLIATLQSMSPIDQYDGVGRMLDMVMLPDSAKLFAQRMESPEKPITMEQIELVVRWLLKAYGGGRPTTPSTDSQQLPIGNGTSLMDGVQPGVSTP